MPHDLEYQASKGVFISGIYTVNPLTPEKIVALGKKLNIKGSHYLEILKNRPANILYFGIIRGEKGLDQALEFATYMIKKLADKEGKIIIAGKLMVNMAILRVLFSKIFDIENLFYDELKDALHIIKNVTLKKQEVKEFTKIEKLIANNSHTEFNDFCYKFYQKLTAKYPDKVAHIEIHFDVSEEKLWKLAMQCRYAIKLDHKGMANNASTIASCLGLYLPVFTTWGLLTDPDFQNKELSKERFSTGARYEKVVIMPEENYYVDEHSAELKPINPSVEAIYHFIEQEKLEDYEKRLKILNQLYRDGVFNCDSVTKQLLEKVFLPLVESKPVETLEKGSGLGLKKGMDE